MLSLVVVRGPDRGRAFPLPEREPQLVGRSTEALDLSDPSISRRHAELTPDDGRWTLRDLGSRHGTFVNGARISGAVAVAAGDRVRCGDSEFLLVDEGAAPTRAVDAGDVPARRIVEARRIHDDRDALRRDGARGGGAETSSTTVSSAVLSLGRLMRGPRACRPGSPTPRRSRCPRGR